MLAGSGPEIRSTRSRRWRSGAPGDSLEPVEGAARGRRERSMMARWSGHDRTNWTRGIEPRRRASIGRYTYAATVPMHGRPSWPIRLNVGRLAILLGAWLIPRRGTIDSPTRLLPRSEPYRCTREKNLSCLWPCPSHAELAGRLRYAGHPAWPRNRQCTNILPAPVDGGRSGPPATR